MMSDGSISSPARDCGAVELGSGMSAYSIHHTLAALTPRDFSANTTSSPTSLQTAAMDEATSLQTGAPVASLSTFATLMCYGLVISEGAF